MEKNTEYFNVLVTDIGGTNARMRLTKIPLDKTKEAVQIDYKKLVPKNFNSLEECCSEYLKDFIGTENYPIIAVIAIPGPIKNNKCEIISNLMHWGTSDGNSIAEKLKLKKVFLLNDFVVCGYGVLSNLKENTDYFVINQGKSDENGSMGILGPGTGLGHALGFKSEKSKYHEIFPSEGGHQLFLPQTQIEWEYRNYLAEKMKLDHISLERGLAGPAIPYMYNFFIDIAHCLGQYQHQHAGFVTLAVPPGTAMPTSPSGALCHHPFHQCLALSTFHGSSESTPCQHAITTVVYAAAVPVVPCRRSTRV